MMGIDSASGADNSLNDQTTQTPIVIGNRRGRGMNRLGIGKRIWQESQAVADTIAGGFEKSYIQRSHLPDWAHFERHWS